MRQTVSARVALRAIQAAALLGLGACGDSVGSASATAGPAGGSISIGAQRWTLVPAIQCGIYPGNSVSIAGHAQEDSAVEIVIDWGDPRGVRVGDSGSADSWRAVERTLEIEIDGRQLRGRAQFYQGYTPGDETTAGTFEVHC